MPVEHILYEMSWQNLVMYSAATPMFDDEKDDELDIDWDRLDANNPDNFQDADEYAR